MKSRLNQLPDNRLLQQITTMQQTLAALKTAQTAGSTDVQLTDVVTGSPVDFTVTVPPLAQTIWEITFTPNDTTFDFTGWVWHLFFNGTLQSGTVSFEDAIEALVPTGTEQTWRLYFVGTTSGTSAVITMTVEAYAIGQGTFTFTQIL